MDVDPAAGNVHTRRKIHIRTGNSGNASYHPIHPPKDPYPCRKTQGRTPDASILYTRRKIYIHIGNQGMYPKCPLITTGRYAWVPKVEISGYQIFVAAAHCVRPWEAVREGNSFWEIPDIHYPSRTARTSGFRYSVWDLRPRPSQRSHLLNRLDPSTPNFHDLAQVAGWDPHIF